MEFFYSRSTCSLDWFLLFPSLKVLGAVYRSMIAIKLCKTTWTWPILTTLPRSKSWSKRGTKHWTSWLITGTYYNSKEIEKSAHPTKFIILSFSTFSEKYWQLFNKSQVEFIICRHLWKAAIYWKIGNWNLKTISKNKSIKAFELMTFLSIQYS